MVWGLQLRMYIRGRYGLGFTVYIGYMVEGSAIRSDPVGLVSPFCLDLRPHSHDSGRLGCKNRRSPNIGGAFSV